MNSQAVLIVEDDPDIREGIHILLCGEGYTVVEAGSGEQALELFNDAFDLVILDVMLPGMSGIKVCEELRKHSTVPVLFLTARSLESDKTIGLTAGGDDYLVKPFSYAELIARVKSLVRRYCVYQGKNQSAQLAGDNTLECGRIKVALDRNEVWKDGEPLNLTDIEYRLLLLLIQHRQRLFSTESIYEQVWDEPYIYSANSTVMVHIRNLRSKIEDDPKNPVFIKNVWGKGYRFEGERDTL